jgi:hypothetical protein
VLDQRHEQSSAHQALDLSTVDEDMLYQAIIEETSCSSTFCRWGV